MVDITLLVPVDIVAIVEQEPFAPMILPATGGYSNSSDDWRLGTAMNPVSG